MTLGRSVIFSLIFTLIYALPAYAEIPTMTVSEIQPGMTGFGKTVISGTEIREFDVEVIDIFQDLGYDGGPLIFVRMSGEVIDETGGIAGGYSGSPVFIDGKLIGALSWGPYYTKGDVAGITPINNMMKALTYDNSEEPERISMLPTSFASPVDVAGSSYDNIILAGLDRDPDQLLTQFGEDTLVMTPAHAPLIVSGISDAGFERLQEFAADRLPYMDLVKGPGGGNNEGVPILLGPTTLEPGASIGASLATGDIDLTAIGTLTWIGDDGSFLAFGHPFLMDGPTNLPFVTSKIVYTMPSIERSYKMGEAIEIVGTVTQDRATTIAGQLREIPDMVDFHVEIIDHDLNRTRRYDYSVIDKEEWLGLFTYLLPSEAFAYTMDRMGPGTVKVSYSINGEGLKEPIERENIIYGAYSLPMEAVGEVAEAVSLLTDYNQYRDVHITEINISVEVTSARQTADIIKARFNNAPNMGPGAVGYSGPEEDGDSDTQPEEMTFDMLNFDPSAQEIPYEELEDMEAQMMDMYESEYYGGLELVGYHPGDTVEILVTLRPYREEPVENIIQLKIPDDFQPGITSVEIYGGGLYWYGGYGGIMYTDTGIYLPPEDLDEIINSFQARDKGNSIIASLMAQWPTDPYYYLQDDYEQNEAVKSSTPSDNVVYGYYSLPIEIVSDEGEEEYVEDPMNGEYISDEMIVLEQGSTSADGRNPHRN